MSPIAKNSWYLILFLDFDCFIFFIKVESRKVDCSIIVDV